MAQRIVLGALFGVVAGIVIEIVLVVFASIWAFVNSVRVDIPGVYMVRPDGSSGFRGLAFEPHPIGLAVTLAVIVVVFVLGALYLGRARNPGRSV